MTWFRVGGAGIPSSLKNNMNSVLNKKFGTTGQNYPPNGWPADVNLLGPLPEGTASGLVATITDGADDVPVKSCAAALPASISGYTEISITKTGKNLFDKNDVEDNTWIIVDSTDTEATISYRTSGYIPVKANTRYYVTGKSSNRSAYYDTNKNGIAYFSFSGGTAFTSLYDGYIRITIKNDVDLDTFIINEGNIEEQYESFGETYTESLGRLIYGGSADLVTGHGVNGYAKGSMSSSYLSGLNSDYIGYESTTAYFGGHPSVWVRNWNYQTAAPRRSGGIGCACNYFPISMHNTTIFAAQYRIYFDVNGKNISSVQDFINFVANLEANNESLDIVYELATTTDFYFDGQEINSLYGVNNFWNDAGGDTSVVYRRDIALALQAVSSSRGLMMASRPVTQLVGEESDPDQVNELNEEAENTEEQEGDNDAR